MDYCNVMYLIVTAKAVSVKDLAKINKLIPIETSYDEADPKLTYRCVTQVPQDSNELWIDRSLLLKIIL